jgi:esterase/lipase superfamily enzyme
MQADMFENLLTSSNVKEVNILAHDLGLTVALELLARQVKFFTFNEKQKAVIALL